MADQPLAVAAHAANRDDVTLVQRRFDLYMIEARPEYSIGDCAYDSHQLDAKLHDQGAELIAPHRSYRFR